MRTSGTSTWARLRVFFGLFLLGLFALGGLLIYASTLAEPSTVRGGADLRALGLEVMILAAIAGALAPALRNRLSRD